MQEDHIYTKVMTKGCTHVFKTFCLVLSLRYGRSIHFCKSLKRGSKLKIVFLCQINLAYVYLIRNFNRKLVLLAYLKFRTHTLKM